MADKHGHIYRRVSQQFYADEKVARLSRPQPNGESLFLFLIAGPMTGPIPGLMRASRGQMAEDLSWSRDGFDRAWEEVQLEGLARADFSSKVVWVPGALRHNPPASPNVVMSWRKYLPLIPECPLKQEAIAAMGAWLKDHMAPAFFNAFAQACGKASGNASTKPSGNQEQEQDQEQETPGRAVPPAADDWVSFDPIAAVANAYSTAYNGRYQVAPIVSSKSKAQFKQIVDRLGAAAAEVAAFYVTHCNRKVYLEGHHCLDFLVRDAESIHTQFAQSAQGLVCEDGGAPWFTSQKGIIERGRKHGMEYDETQHFHEFRAQVFKAEGVTDQMLEAAQRASGSRVRESVHIRARKAATAH
jgi:hypothetical protein